MSKALTSRSLAAIRFEIVFRSSSKRPSLLGAQECPAAQARERLRPAEAPLLALLGSKPPPADQARLLGIQPQPKRGQTRRQVTLEPLGVRAMLKAQDGVVGVPDDQQVTAGIPPAPVLGPQIEDVVQLDVRAQGRNSRRLRRPVLA
jgi:hypothetical protein